MANPVGAIVVVLRRPVLGRLAYARFCADVARTAHQPIWTFFVTHQFAWNTARIGVVMTAGALAGAVFQARAVGPLVRRFGEKRAAVAGSLLGVASLTGMVFVSVPWMLYVLQAFGMLGSLAGAAAQSWISRSIRADEQGTVQGALTGIDAVAETMVPTRPTRRSDGLWRTRHPVWSSSVRPPSRPCRHSCWPQQPTACSGAGRERRACDIP